MKNFMKKFFAVVLVAAFATMCFVSCGNSSDEKVIVLGGIGPITGDYAQYGLAVMNSMQIAVDEINEAGGVNGFKFKLEFEDDQADPEKGVAAYNALKDKNLMAVLGCVTSGSCKAVEAEAVVDNVFLLTPSGSSVDCIPGDNAFRICFNDDDQGSASAQYIADNNLAKKVAVIYDSSSNYSSGIYQSFKDKAVELGKFEVVDTNTSFTSDAAKSFDAQIQTVKNSGADMVFLPIYYSEAFLIIKSAVQAGLDVTFFGCDGLDGMCDIIESYSDAQLVDGVKLLTPFVATSSDEAVQKFVSKYQTICGNVPNQFGADGYDAVYVVKAAMEKAGITSSKNYTASEFCELIKAAMTEISVDGVTGKNMTWSANGEPSKSPKAMYITITAASNSKGFDWSYTPCE